MSTQVGTDRPSYLELRAKLDELVRGDLLGPMEGAEEEVDEGSVRGRYIVGLLAPKGQSVAAEELDELAVSGGGNGQDGKNDSVVPQSASILPSSIGLTFTVTAETEAIRVKARWGRYRRSKSDFLETKKGNPKTVWKREPVEGVHTFTLREGMLGPWSPDDESEQVYVRGLCRKWAEAWTVTLFLVNAQEQPKRNRDEAWVFQPELIVTAPKHQAVFIKRSLPPDLQLHEPEDRAMSMLYRREVEFAVGHGVGVHADLAAGHWDRASRIRTSVMPSYEVERMDPPTATDIPGLGKAVFDMQVLSDTAQGGFTAHLAPLADAYEAWIGEQEVYLASPSPDLQPYKDDAYLALRNCKEALQRIRRGIALLDSDRLAAEVFKFANRAMHWQRVRSIYAGQARQGQKADLKKIDIPRNRSWRPFQLAFLLLNLPAMSDPTDKERQQLADLLWFPTGGGKTEAYLGVAAFAIGIRRLQGELGGLSGHAGVTVLMRYTLRLLTLQQFQRAATLMAACEMIRRDNPTKWGDEPFRIGLWVGQRSTPNWTKDAGEAIKQNRGNKFGGALGGRGSPAQLTNCPWCGKPIDAGKNIHVESYEQGRGRTFQYCSDKYGRCPFSFKKSPHEGLPIVVVDEEIYRRLPTLLIATVDKFAQMPWKGETQMLFGRVNGYCPRHGFRSPDLKDANHHPKKGKLPACKSQEIGPLRPPDLIIQDELHLISGPLGTLVGLYETAVDRLCTWELDGQKVKPKIIASTATIRRAKAQVNNLFLRQVRIFPPAALNASDNFFSRRRPSSEKAPGRLYVGVCVPGMRLKAVLIRVYVAYMSAAQQLYQEYGAMMDPWMTLVGYFNSMRELGGMRRVSEDAVRTRLQKMDRRGLAKRFINHFDIEELTSRKGAADIPKILDRLETSFEGSPHLTSPNNRGRTSPHLTSPNMPHASGQGGGTGKRKKNKKYPLDIVLATNMISVGVDVSRLGLMVTAGQPKATAEYIQATSRVGRRFPGLVCTVYNWARPRDLSHYERFEHYHATFYQQVEALSVTPFAARALDRGLTGVMVSLIRLLGTEFNGNQHANDLLRAHPYLDDALNEIGERAGLVTASQEIEDDVRARIKERLDLWLKQITPDSGSILGYKRQKDGRTVPLLYQPTEKDWHKFTCLNSLRDVEPNVALILDDHGMD